MAKGRTSDIFEIIVIVAIVAIVAFTGQVLIYFDSTGTDPGSNPDSGTLLTGFAVSEDTSEESLGYIDVAVEKIEVSPQSPMMGDPFQVTVYLKNRGTASTETPFYIEASFQPMTEEGMLEPIRLPEIMTKNLGPEEQSSVSFLVSAIMPEGPLRITATADSTGKIEDHNIANNQLSKTIIIALE